MKQKRNYSEEQIEELNTLRIQLADEMVCQFGEYEEIGNIIKFNKTLKEIGSVLLLSNSLISRLLRFPTAYDKKNQPSFDAYKITIAKVKILNKYDKKVKRKQRLELHAKDMEIKKLTEKINKVKKLILD